MLGLKFKFSARLNYVSQKSFLFMLLLKVGIRNPFAQDVVVGKEAAVLLSVCVESRGWGTRMLMPVVASLLVHLIGTRHPLGPQPLRLPLTLLQLL